MTQNQNRQQEWSEKPTNLGSGGFGIIRLFINNKTGEHLAVKECKNDNLSERTKERWRNECEIMLKLDSPYIVKSIPLPEELRGLNDKPNPVLPMEFCNKGDLRKELNQPYNMLGLEEHQVKAIVHDVSSAVQYLHKQKIYHRDLKPENIVLNKLPECRIIYKIIDLGYAKEVTQDSICTSFVGTIQYIAPELMSSTQPQYTGTVDFWSLGTTAFECIAGFRPFVPCPDPYQWLEIIRSKNDMHICACRNNGRLVFSEKIPTNKLSDVSQSQFENWLRLLLMYDASRRGGGKDQDGRHFCHKLLDIILEHKPHHVFDPMNNKSYFFDVVGNESLSTVGQLASLFPNINDNQLVFCTTSGIVPGHSENLVKFLSPVNYDLDQEYDDIDIGLIIAYSSPQLPAATRPKEARLDQMYRKDKSQTYSDQLKMSKYLTHHCNVLYRSFQHLLKSAEGVKLCMLREKSSFVDDVKKLDEVSKNLESKLELFTESLHLDIGELEKMPNFLNKSSLFDSWKKQKEDIEAWNNLLDSAEIHMDKLKALECRIFECLKSPCSQYAERDKKIKSHFKRSLEIIEELKEVPHGEQGKVNKIADIVNCHQSCGNDWEQFFLENRSHIRTCVNVYKDVVCLKNPVKNLIKEVDDSCRQLSLLQMNRQQNLWKMAVDNSSTDTTLTNVDSHDLCTQSYKIIERVQTMLSETNQYTSIVESYDWSFLDQHQNIFEDRND